MESTKIPGLQVKNDKIVIDKMVEGVRIYKTLDTTDIVLAQKIMARLVNSVLERQYLPKRRSMLTVRDIISSYWDGHMKYKKYAYNAHFILSAVSERIGGIKIHSVTKADILKYIRERLADKKRNGSAGCISPRTVQMELQYLSMAVNFAVDNRLLDTNPIKRFIYVPRGLPKKIVLDDGRENGPEWAAIYGAASDDLRPIILTLYETGMRPNECLRMRWSWLTRKDERRCLITVPSHADKAGYEHDVPVSAPLLELFRGMGMKNSEALVFPSLRRRCKPRRSIHDAFTEALNRCGLAQKGITPYALRRTRITIWDAIDSNASRYAAGHVPAEIHTRHYVRIPPERLFRLVGM
ncbi:MAG: tyrosine-type recombinase/integrase [Chitinispirillia bacterium]|nr:tyrosine-type recombinase/integrase [Chitinispirillia bacterium]